MEIEEISGYGNKLRVTRLKVIGIKIHNKTWFYFIVKQQKENYLLHWLHLLLNTQLSKKFN